MITVDQQKWIDHLSDIDKVVIKPYDTSCGQKFREIKRKIKKLLGVKTRVEHRGATSLKISGQDEIDVYIPVFSQDFDNNILKLTQLFGKPRSHYPLERARFVTIQDGKHVDVFLINKHCQGCKDGVNFEKYLKTHPKTLERYEKLKEAGNGLSTREYYRRKIEFINEVLTYNRPCQK